MGCTIGQGVSAASLLAVSAPVAMLSVAFGARLGLAYLLEGSVLGVFSFSHRKPAESGRNRVKCIHKLALATSVLTAGATAAAAQEESEALVAFSSMQNELPWKLAEDATASRPEGRRGGTGA